MAKSKPPVVPLDVADTDETRETTGETLRFNEEADSFELDTETEDAEYQHPAPYDTAAAHGEDALSSYDEANPFTADEYRDNQGDLAELADEGVEDPGEALDERDEQLAQRPEPSAGDTDEEGYPVRDDAGGDDNPIQPEGGQLGRRG